MRNVLIIALLLMAAGCTKDYTILPKGPKQLYVISGRVSNMRGPYYVRVTKSQNPVEKDTSTLSWVDNAEAVKDAQVIITDDMGVTDTLMPVDPNGERYGYSYANGKLDSTVGPLSFFDLSLTADHGYYETKKITGIPGHTYHLQVRVGDETFQASAYMPPVPVLDSVATEPDRTMGGSENAFAYFKESQGEKNYYLLQLAPIHQYPYDATQYLTTSGYQSRFHYYVFDDKTLAPYVSHMEIDAIATGDFNYGRPMPYSIILQEPSQARLSALTRETYEYFNTVVKQFADDGNVYKPTPASAVGNISGGALGLFWATSISYKLVLR
jgi:hypothetical protein